MIVDPGKERLLHPILVANYQAANLGQTSYIKPFKKPDLKYFKEYKGKNISVKIDGEIYAIKGTVTLEGIYNLMCWNKQYFFLELIKSLGDINHEYAVTRWFGVNDVLDNSDLVIKGVLGRTSSSNFFSHNYALTTPTISSGNDSLFFPVVTDPNALKSSQIDIRKPLEFLQNPNHYKLLQLEEDKTAYFNANPIKDPTIPSIKAVYPYSIYCTGEIQLLQELCHGLHDSKVDLQVFDLNTSGSKKNLASILGPKYSENKNKHFVIANKNYTGTKEFANTLVQSHSIDNIDLSALTGIQPILEEGLKQDDNALKEEKMGSENPGILRTKLNKFDFRRVGEKRVIKKDGAIRGDIKEFGFTRPYSKTSDAEVIIGYTDKGEKITQTLGHPKSIDHLYIDLSHYEIELNESPLTGQIIDEDVKNFLIGKSEILDHGFINKGLVLEDTVYQGPRIEDRSLIKETSFDIGITTIKRIYLSPGGTLNDKPYIEYLYGAHLHKTAERLQQGLPNSGVFKEDQEFASIYGAWVVYSLKDYAPPNQEEWDKNNSDLIKYFQGERKFKKSYIKELFKKLAIGSHTDFLISGIFSGFAVSMPKKIYGPLKLKQPRNLGGYSEPKVKYDIASTQFLQWPDSVEEAHSFYSFSGCINRGKAHFDKKGGPFLTDNSSSTIVHARDRTRCEGTLLINSATKSQEGAADNNICGAGEIIKIINAGFTNGDGDSEGDGDFYLMDQPAKASIYATDLVTRKRHVIKERYGIEIFKIYKGAVYPFFLFFRNEWNELLPEYQKQKLSFPFRKYYVRTFGQTQCYTCWTFDNDKVKFSDIFGKLYILDKKGDQFRQPGDNIYRMGSVQSSDFKNDGGSTYYIGDGNIPLGERVQITEMKVKDYQNYINKNTVLIGTDMQEAMRVLRENKSPFLDNDGTINHNVLNLSKNKQLFDLLGTNFYLYREKTDEGVNFELIIKNNDTTLKNVVTKVSYKMAQATRFLEDPIEIVNSSLSLNLGGTQIPIKGRGPIIESFKPSEFFLTPLTREGANSADDVYLLICRTEMDYIREIIKVMKPESALVSQMSIKEREDLRFRYQQELLLSKNQMASFNLSRNKFYADLRRQEEDIAMADDVKNWSMASGIISSIASAATIPFTGPIGMISGIAGAISTGASWQQAEDEKYKRKRDHEFSKTWGTREFNLRADAEKVNFQLRDMQKKMEIYNLSTNAVLQSPSGDSTLFSSIKEKLKTADVYLQVVYPTGQQYENLKKYYQEYGYTVNIPDVTVTPLGFQKDEVIKFDHIDEIKGIDHPIIASNVKAIFLEGFRIKEF